MWLWLALTILGALVWIVPTAIDLGNQCKEHALCASRLQPGWLPSGESIDLSDVQYRNFRNNLVILAPAAMLMAAPMCRVF